MPFLPSHSDMPVFGHATPPRQAHPTWRGFWLAPRSSASSPASPHVWGPSPSVKLEGFGIREVGIRDELGMG